MRRRANAPQDCRTKAAGRPHRSSGIFMLAYFAAGLRVLYGDSSFSVCDSPSARIRISPLARRGRGDPPVPYQDETEERLRPLMIRSLEGDAGAHRQLLGML